MESKTSYVAVYGNNQVPFSSFEQLQSYFDNAGDMFDSVMDKVKFFKVIVEPINPFENA